VAILSCKGQSNTAARMFIDHACRVDGGVPLLKATDMDKSGFEIALRLTTVSDHAREHDLVKYEFKNKINARHIGLRLADVKKYGLKSEWFQFKGRFAKDSSATKEEQEFLRSNKRVELNAFTAPQFIEWIETKLTEFLGPPLIPDEKTLANAYQRALVVASINQAVEAAREAAIKAAQSADIPGDLREQVRLAMGDRELAWDQAVYKIAAKTCPRGTQGKKTRAPEAEPSGAED
jgi:hypothetical protein